MPRYIPDDTRCLPEANPDEGYSVKVYSEGEVYQMVGDLLVICEKMQFLAQNGDWDEFFDGNDLERELLDVIVETRSKLEIKNA